MKHVRESLSQYYDYKFFKVFEEKDEEKTELQDKEADGLAVIDKLNTNFDEFKKAAGGEILKYKEFWEENQQAKQAFDENGSIYKMFDSDYVIGVMELPAETLSDGSIDGGMGATDEPEEEIIEGPEIGAEEVTDEPQEDFFEEQTVPNPTNEAIEEDDEFADLEDPDGGEDVTSDIDAPSDELPADDAPAESPEEEMPMDDMPAEEPLGTEAPDLTAPQTYFVVYDISGDEREEIFRCGSNNVVNAFNAFYNDTFKGAMKNAIIKYKEATMAKKAEAEKEEKKKVETEKQSKIKKFLGEGRERMQDYVSAAHTLNEGYSDMMAHRHEEYDEERDESYYDDDDARFDDDGNEYYIVDGEREYADPDVQAEYEKSLNENEDMDDDDNDFIDLPLEIGFGPGSLTVDWVSLEATHEFDWDHWDSKRKMIHDIEAFAEGENDMIGTEFEETLEEYGYEIDYDQLPFETEETSYGISVTFPISKI